MEFIKDIYGVLRQGAVTVYRNVEFFLLSTSQHVNNRNEHRPEAILPSDSSSMSLMNRVQRPSRRTMFNRSHPIPLVVTNENHIFSLDEEALRKVLLQDKLKDYNVVIVSVAGAFRKGKSFLLDFLIRYLKYTYKTGSKWDYIKSLLPTTMNNTNWLGMDHHPLDGFSWCGGSERNTTGILMWSEVFYTTLPNDEKVAIILLDTQGTFDNESTVKDGTTIFALSTMLSSIQIFNLSQNIQEDDLQHLQFFTEYGRLALNDSTTKPFQKLQFLVRDWGFPYEANYGAEGGQKLLSKKLGISNKQDSELRLLREQLKNYFTDIQCFLMPHPGLKVVTNPHFDGRLADIETEFKSYLKEFVPLLLSPENLVLKEIGGRKIKMKEFFELFKCYMNLFNGNDLPHPKSVLMATAEANNLSAVAAAKETYLESMHHVCSGSKSYRSPDLQLLHDRCRDEAVRKFLSIRKVGGEEYSKSFLIQLERDIEKHYDQFKAVNAGKINTTHTFSNRNDENAVSRRLLTELREIINGCLVFICDRTRQFCTELCRTLVPRRWWGQEI